MTRRLPTIALIGTAGLLFGLAAPPAPAQELTWEQVGDRPVNAYDLDLTPGGTLWAARPGYVWYLDSGSNTWIDLDLGAGNISNFILALNSDTLFVATSSGIHRSPDGGVTFELVFSEGGALWASPLSGPNHGLLLSGVRASDGTVSYGAAYSADRGATWALGVFEVPELWLRECYAFAAFPAGHPYAGRLLAGCLGGMAYSDDGGALWHYSDLWQTFAQEASAVVVGPDGTAYAIAFEAGVPDIAVYASADGVAWERRGTLLNLGELVMLDEPGGDYALVAVTAREAPSDPGVYGSTDEGWTWSLLGRVPLEDVDDALLGPEGRLYATGADTEEQWVYRTTVPLVVANEPDELPAEAHALRVWPNPASRVFQIEAEASEAVFYDVLGREVLRVHLGSVTEADVSGLAPGVYLVRAGSESAVVTVRR